MKRKSEAPETTEIAVGDEVLIDRGRIVYVVESLDENVATVTQGSTIVGARKYAPRDPNHVGSQLRVIRKVDVYRLNKVAS